MFLIHDRPVEHLWLPVCGISVSVEYLWPFRPSFEVHLPFLLLCSKLHVDLISFRGSVEVYDVLLHILLVYLFH